MKKTPYSILYRILHWVIAFSFLLLLITIFLRMTWLNKYHLAAIIKDYMYGTGQVLPQDQIIALAKDIRRPMWNWHIYIGYLLAGLFTLRFLLPIFSKMKFQNPFRKDQSIKMRFKNGSYLLFYIFVIVSLVTGMFLEFGPDQLKKPIESIHVLGIYYLLAFIIIHLAGVFFAEFTDQKGIISRIVSGSNKNKKSEHEH